LDQLFREENRPIRELAITPILLSLTCAVFHQTGKFYSKRSKLYEEGLELLLEQWDKSREIERDEIYRVLSVERKLELLSHLAVKKFEQEQYVLFEQTEIEGYIAEFLKIGRRESQAVLKAIESQHGLLIERSYKVWSFSHLTFQEYLVAKRTIDNFSLEKICLYLINRATKSSWQEVYLLVIEMWKNSNEIILEMKQEIDALTRNYKNLQRLLNWAYNKSLSIQLPYKDCAIRAFYLECSFDIANKTKESNLVFAMALATDIAIEIDFNLKHEPEHARAFNCDLAFQLDSDFELINNATFYALYNYYQYVNRSDFWYYEIRDFFEIIDYICDHIQDFGLQKQLEKTEAQLPPLVQIPEEHRENFKYWWEANSKMNMRALIEQLKIVAVQYFNIGIDWQFSQEEKDQLKRYYYANKLLAKYLNVENSDLRIKEEIETTLLLPIAEIEKRKREKVE
jgi:hypothetical protein